jgi:hypothetical protein
MISLSPSQLFCPCTYTLGYIWAVWVRCKAPDVAVKCSVLLLRFDKVLVSNLGQETVSADVVVLLSHR